LAAIAFGAALATGGSWDENMRALIYLTFAIGICPFVVGIGLLWRRLSAPVLRPSIQSILLCTLAFNLTYFWQELWLVIPKAITPGLHPILYHNNHTWTGSNPLAELLQGTGAVATLVSGLAFSTAVPRLKKGWPTLHLFFYWMAFQGLYQSLTQVIIGAIIPANDVGRAFTYLGIGNCAKQAVLLVAIVCMALAGFWLARRFPEAVASGHHLGSPAIGSMIFAAIASVALIVPFRVPRSPIEVVVVPLIINLIGSGWIAIGAALSKPKADALSQAPSQLWESISALGLMLVIFQTVLRAGVKF